MEEKIRSGKRRHEIRTVGNPSGKIYITKYVVDLDVLPKITEIHIYAGEDGKVHIPEEYRSVVVYGANVKTLAVALYSEGVMANDRITGFLNGACVGMLGLSAGNVYGFCRKLSEKSQKSIYHLEERLWDQKVVATDATTVTVNERQNYIRNFSIGDTVVYRAMKSKAIPALEKLGFLKQYTDGSWLMTMRQRCTIFGRVTGNATSIY